MLDLGFYIGITGWICVERRAAPLRDAVSILPLDRVLIETDAPYLLPRDMMPKPASRRNEPAYVTHILERVANWRGEEAQWLEAVTDNNARRLFNIHF